MNLNGTFVTNHNKESDIRLLDLIMCLSDAMDFIDPAVVSHHKQVAFIAHSIGVEMGLSYTRQKELVLAGSLHDIGSFSLKDRMDTLAFEIRNPHLHAEQGYGLLSLFEPIRGIARIVRFHHVPWDRGHGAWFGRQQVPVASHILHLADRVAVLINRRHEVLSQAPSICAKIRKNAGALFMPKVVDAFMGLAAKECFWLDSVSHSFQSLFSDKLKNASIRLDSEDMIDISELFSMVIDFKSPFTATHSSGVARSAEMLSAFLGFTRDESRLMRIAGHLHDLGKLAVPVEILHKPSKLKEKEFNVIRHHTFYTFRILETIPSFHIISKWAAFHHERLDGSGYPFHIKAKDLPLGSQIMAVADVYTAVSEDRPYRKGMPRDNAVRVLDSMVRDSALNSEIVSVLKSNYDEIEENRRHAQSSARTAYKDAVHKIGEI